MSAILAYPASTASRRDGIAHYSIPNPFFQYSHPSLNVVTTSPSSIENFGSRDCYPGSVTSAWDTDTPYRRESAPSASLHPLRADTSLSPSSRSIHSSTPQNLGARPTSYASQHASYYGASSSQSQAAGSYTHSSRATSTSSALASASLAHTSPSFQRSHYIPSIPASDTNAAQCACHTGPRYAVCHVNSSLETIDAADSTSTIITIPRPPSPTVIPSSNQMTKIESERDSELAIEIVVPLEHVSGKAHLAEVPLRAINASSRMKRMMRVFRLDIFAAHDGIHPTATRSSSSYIEVGPLEEEPVEFEWQVQLNVPLIAEERVAFDDEATRHGDRSQGDVVRKSTPSSPPPSGGNAPAARWDSAPSSAASAGSKSPIFSMSHSFAIDNDPYDASSDHHQPEDSSRSGFPCTPRPTFASVVTPTQLGYGWSSMPGYQLEVGDSNMESRWPTSCETSPSVHASRASLDSHIPSKY